ncbi:MAG: GtrA family protein, partial [Chlamydiia bacterium]|nr:GtrA family protein [Chlamydiia bacterium]
RETFLHFLRYIMAGTVAVSVQFAVLTFCVEVLRIFPTVSSAIGYVCGCSTNYVLQYYFTFKAKGDHLNTFLTYVAINVCTLCINLFIFWFLTDIWGLWYVFSQVFAIMVVVFVNFYLNRRFTFRHR